MFPEYYDCFLSYCSEDAAVAEEIHARLTAAGFKVWWDKAYLAPEMRWHEEIERHCEASRIVIPLLTPQWKNSLWTRYETYGAARVVPLLLRGTWTEAVTPPLSIFQSDLVVYESATSSDWERLIARLQTYRDEPRPVRGEKGRATLLKHRPIEHFVGRDPTMVELHEKLFLSRPTALTQGSVIALPALGGIGKTTLARHYAEKFWRCYRQMFWVDCRTGLETGFAEIYDLLNPGQEQAVKVEIRAKRAKQELEQPYSEQRLLILDNAENEKSVLPWLPASGNCHVLITSRFTEWSEGIATHPVWVLDPEPARELLLRRGERAGIAGEEAAADRVAEKLQYLPLALEQAAAYVAQHPEVGFADYSRRFEVNERHYLKRRTPGATDYPDSVYLTWRTTLDALPAGARAMLRLHAFFAPTPFPVSLYIAGAEQLAAEAATDVPDEEAVRDWKESLLRYSMAKQESGGCILVHALVQAVERHEMGDRAGKVAQRAAEMYFRATPAPSWDRESQRIWAGLVSHSRALAGCDLVERELQAKIWGELASAFRHAGSYRKGSEAARRALEARERVLGAEHPDTLGSVNNLAGMLESQGDYAAAEPLYRRALEAWERVLGPEHPDTLTSVNNLAGLLARQGDYAAAKPLYRRALEACERVLGPEHPDTLGSVNNLAYLLKSQGDYTAAEPLYRRALEAWERVLGPEHPATLTSINNLAGLLASQGDYAAAEPLYRRALEARERVLGPEHPDTLGSVNNLAGLLASQGDYAAAEPLYRRALEARERVLGPEHPDTLGSVNNLAYLLERQGDYAVAEPLYRRALEASERVLGAEHPDTLTSVNNLAGLLESQGNYAAAEPLYRRALEARERVLGPQHPDTLGSVNNLAYLLESQGDYAAAEPLYRRALEARERVLGPEHPDTLASVNNLAHLLASQGDYAAAEPLYRRALEAALRVLGPEHPNTKLFAANHQRCLEAMH